MRILAIAAAGLFSITSASAATFYTDVTSWEADMSSTTSVDLPETGATSSFTVDDLTFSITGSASNLVVGSADEFSTLIPGNDLAVSAPEDILIEFGTAVTGFSFLLHEPTTTVGIQDACNATCVETTFNFTLFAGAVEVGSFDFDPANDVANFVGFSSLIAFDSVVINDVTNAIDNEFFGGFRTGELSEVPLPAGLPLFLSGLAAIGLIRRRAK